MPTYRLTLAYRGTAYAGWQRQENALAVQQVVEEALERLLLAGRCGSWGRAAPTPGCTPGGRRRTWSSPEPFPERGLVHGTNRHLPEDVRVLAAAAMPPGFHARKHACGQGVPLPAEPRRRCSRRSTRLSWRRLPAGIDLERMARAADLLPGRHDFSAFALAGGSHGQPFRRIFSALWEESGRGAALPRRRRRVPARHGSCFRGNAGRSRHREAVRRRASPGCSPAGRGRRRGRRRPPTVWCCERVFYPRNGMEAIRRTRCRIAACGNLRAFNHGRSVQTRRTGFPRRASRAPDRPGPAAAPRRHHHGRQRPLGEGARACRGSKGTAPASPRSARRWRRRRAWGSQVLTLYAFSVENWKRPRFEVWTLMNLLKEYVRKEREALVENDIRFNVLGRWRELDPSVVRELEATIEATAPLPRDAASTSPSTTRAAARSSTPAAASSPTGRPASGPTSTRRRSAATSTPPASPTPTC